MDELLRKCYEDIKAYQPYNEQEAVDQKLILNYIKNNSDILLRTNLAAHMTSSAIVVNKTMDKVLFAHHNIYDAYGWVGGHNDGDPDCLHVAVKETKEETGLAHVVPYNDDILMLDTIYVGNHMKHGKYVSDHLHLNVTYLLIADESLEVEAKLDENSDVKWFDIDTVLEHVNEPRMIPIYQKAFEKIRNLNK